MVYQWIQYTSDDIKGMFVDAEARGEPEDGEIIGWHRFKNSDRLCAVILNNSTGTAGIYEMNIIERRPYLVATLHPRAWASREFKLWRAERNWQNR